MTLQKPDFTEFHEGQLSKLYCKRCGVVIAAIIERPKGDPKIDRNGNRVDTYVERFTRFPAFTELKMALKDGSFHITTGCNKCLTHELTLDELQELMQADIEEQRASLGPHIAVRLAARIPLSIVGIKEGGGIT